MHLVTANLPAQSIDYFAHLNPWDRVLRTSIMVLLAMSSYVFYSIPQLAPSS